jgi:hypothetical protein
LPPRSLRFHDSSTAPSAAFRAVLQQSDGGIERRWDDVQVALRRSEILIRREFCMGLVVASRIASLSASHSEPNSNAGNE